MILVSACLAGLPCRCNGTASSFAPVLSLPREAIYPCCPETAAGFGVPREPMELTGGRLVTRDGADFTEALEEAIEHLLGAADRRRVRAAVLKERSPSCGVHCIYDGSFSGRLIPGSGKLAERLRSWSVPLYCDEHLDPSAVYQDLLGHLGASPL